MCGIAGLCIKQDSPPVENGKIIGLIKKMTATLAPRGPDAFGHLLSFPIAFGHRRLSILDLTEAGSQPMQLGENGPVITYNGEVYNFRDLRKELETKGLVFRSNSDTEVILNVYQTWGLAGLKRLEGIFAFAIWDPRHKRLVLMRDRLGIKPLFYGESTHGLAFGSEIKTVRAAGGVDSRLDDQSFSEYLWFGNTFEDRTFYGGVRSLEPGHWLVIEEDKRFIEPWWRIEEWLARPVVVNSVQDAAYLVRKALDRAVERQLVADVPVGIFLSGGMDSSAIAASAMKLCTQPLHSYTAGFDFDRGVNELPKAALVAQHLGLNHHEIQIDGNDLIPILIKLAKAHDEPFADAANIPLYLMCEKISGQVKVVLQGDGGDELFAGYRRYAVLRNAHWWRLLPKACLPFLRASGKFGQRVARLAYSVGNSDAAMRMAYLLTMETPFDRPEALLQPERRQIISITTDPFLAYKNAAERFSTYEPVQQMMLADLTVQLPSQFFTKVDRATMAAGIEVRLPLLDELVAELVVNMPSEWKVDGRNKKILLRESQRSRLPEEILDGPKTGFGVPYGYWLRTSLYAFSRERLLDKSFLDKLGFIHQKVELKLSEHRSQKCDAGMMLWKLLQLAIWHDIESNS